ncbi:Beta-lactamase [Thalassobacillus cyri]|uniref:Beta-lactamase n=1 Tax=Thalassobacillus cyri TaxID=571932 RepID=A0A1H3ZPB5_9BACI|nr:Beta-lactamase [Thalassobacillus cyri]
MEQAKLNKVIEGVVKTVDFSGVVYIKERDEVTFQSAYGLAHRSARLSNTVHTRFGIASGCKLFTAIGICQLVETGAISFDTKLKDCLNLEFPNFDKNITIHHLLTHTSGISDYFDEEEMMDFEELWKDRPVYEMTSLHDFLPLFQDS